MFPLSFRARVALDSRVSSVSNAPVQFTDPDAHLYPQRFYEAYWARETPIPSAPEAAMVAMVEMR